MLPQPDAFDAPDADPFAPARPVKEQLSNRVTIEREIIGSVISNPACYRGARALRPDDFEDQDHQEIWRAIKECVEMLLAESQQLRINALDTEFHRRIYRAAHNPFLEASLNQYLNLSVRLWYYCRDRLRPKATNGDFHQQVADAILAGDRQAARAGIVAHLKQSSTELREVM